MGHPVYYIQTAQERYLVDAHGFISRPARNLPASKHWRVVSAVRLTYWGRTVERVLFPQCFIHPLEWRFKNGNARWHLVDCDHGNWRQWNEVVFSAGVLPPCTV